MHIQELDYRLPSELVAHKPVEPRELCRLMVIHRKTGEIEHQRFVDLPRYLRKGDLLALNSARVAPARLFASLENEEPGRSKLRGIPAKAGRSHRQFEILVLNANSSSRCYALIYPSWEIGPGTRFISEKSRKVICVRGHHGEGQWELELEKRETHWHQLLEEDGHMPLPPYILKRRATKSDVPEDRVWYQTVYANREGAIAAPTAGLHFSLAMLEQLKKNGIQLADIFLKVGLGTFQPIRTQALQEHILQPEEYEISAEAAKKINNTRLACQRVIAVGTTTVRTLEFSANADGIVKSGNGQTDLFIMPPYSFRVVDSLLTNFHLPKSTLLALVFAFGGMELMRKAYEEAIKERYRFFSYGDAMFIL